MGKIGLLAAASLAAVLSVSSALAQTAGTDRLPEEQRRLYEGIQGTSEAARSAVEEGITSGPEVTYEQVLANPDDPGLNAAYARTQIKNGDLLGASVTLERILLSHPYVPELRLVHGLVLYRLDDLTTAETELAGINPAGLSAEQRAERDQILAQIEQSRQRLHQTVGLTVGSPYDTNRNASPSSGTILIGDLPFTLNGDARKRVDWGILGLATYDAEYDLGTDPRLAAFGSLSIMDDTQITAKTYDSITGGGAGGLRYQNGPVRAEFGAFWNNMTLYGDYYMTDWGVSGRASYQIDPAWEVFGDMRVDRQSFHNIVADPVATDNSGTIPSGWLGGIWHPNAAHSVSLAFGGSRRLAHTEYMSYNRVAARLGDTWLIGAGQFVAATGEFGATTYDLANPTFSAMTRRDRDMRLGLTYGVPLETAADLFGATLPEQTRNVVFSVSGEYYRSISDLTNYTYSNIRTQMLLSKRWEF